MHSKDKSTLITQAGYAVLGLAGAASLICLTAYGTDKAVKRLNQGYEHTITTKCNELRHLTGADLTVRDGVGHNLFGEEMHVKAACWAKGSDGQWRQTQSIIGPISDLYPKSLVKELSE